MKTSTIIRAKTRKIGIMVSRIVIVMKIVQVIVVTIIP